jgi:peptidoglycan/LPS O-acetylase OafA/YrhL
VAVMPSMRYSALDPLRGIAALWVFLHHYESPLGGPLQHWHPAFSQHHPTLQSFLTLGDRGVSMFFVISGYCMAMAASRAVTYRRPVAEFIYRRAHRIYPTFWCSILLICLVRCIIPSLERHWAEAVYAPARDFCQYSWLDWVKVASLTQIFDKRFGLFYCRYGQINGAYWTLGIEFQFYLVVALALLRPRWLYAILTAVTLLAVPVCVSPSLGFAVADCGLFLYWWPWFACGLFLYWALERGLDPRKVFGRHAAAVSIAAIATIFLVFAALVAKQVEIERLVFAVGFTGLLWFGSIFDGHVSDVLQGKRWLPAVAGKALVTLGAMSYSLYLMHNVLSNSISVALQHWFPHGTRWADVVIILGTLVLCYPFYRLCEAPFLATKGLKRAAPSVKTLGGKPAGEEVPLAVGL